jgi:hypothetical protein
VVPQRLAKADRVLRKKTWPATMLRILKQADRLVPYAELKEELAKTHLAPKLARSDKSFYGSLLKLETMGLAVRNGGRAATTEVFQRFKADVEAGRIKDEPIRNTGGDRNSPAKKAILDLLLATGGASPSAIVKELIPKLDLNTKNSKTAVYNLIARLVKRDELIRDGTIIRLPSKSKNGTEPDAEALNKTNVGREFGATTH